MYVEQEMHSSNGDILEILLIPKNMCKDGYVWILGPRSFRITSHFPYKAKPSNPVLVSVDVDTTPHSSSYMKLVRHCSSSQRPPLQPP